MKTTVLSDDAKSIFTSNVQLLWLIPCWGAYSLQVQLFPTFDGSDHEKVLLCSELKCDLAHSSRSQLLCLPWEGPLESGIQKQAQTGGCSSPAVLSRPGPPCCSQSLIHMLACKWTVSPVGMSHLAISPAVWTRLHHHVDTLSLR